MTGAPVLLEEEELEEVTAHAEELIVEEAARSRSPPSCPDPGTRGRVMADSDISSLRKRHAFLEDFSDEFIRSTTVGDLMKIETTAVKLKEIERSKDASDRLALNKPWLPPSPRWPRVQTTDGPYFTLPGFFLGPAALQLGCGCLPGTIWA